MKLSGFTFIRDAVKCEYPVVESITSILPIVDEFVINVGLPDEDGTLDLIREINDPKIKIIQSQWNPNLDMGCYVYTQQANIALFNCMGKWAFYLQADEVVHEDDYPIIIEHLDRYINDDRVDGLVLKQLNFWGDYKTILSVYPKWERRRCWIVKPHRFILCAKDASRFTVHKKFKEKGTTRIFKQRLGGPESVPFYMYDMLDVAGFHLENGQVPTNEEGYIFVKNWLFIDFKKD